MGLKWRNKARVCVLCFRLAKAQVQHVAIFAQCHQNANGEKPLSPSSQLPRVSVQPRDQMRDKSSSRFLSLFFFFQPHAHFLCSRMYFWPVRWTQALTVLALIIVSMEAAACFVTDSERRGLFGSSSAWLLKWSNAPGFAPSLCDFRGILRLMGRIKLCRGPDRSLHFKCGTLSGTGKLLQAMFVIGWIRENTHKYSLLRARRTVR